jgi:acetyltransferase
MMSQGPLDALFNPRSIVLVGDSTQAGSIGAALAANLSESCKNGFRGRVKIIAGHRCALGGRNVCSDIASLPEAPDLGVICASPGEVPAIIDQLGARGTRAVIVASAGFRAPRHSGAERQRAAREAAARHRLRLVGPNSLGLLVPGIGLNASFAHRAPAAGRLAFVAQSGAIVTSVIDWAVPRGVGFSHLISLGDMGDVGFGDVLDHLAKDPSTRGILLSIEAIANARRFLSAARAAARMKPIIVVKAGRHPDGARAVTSHTGAMAGNDAVYDAVFRRAGLLRVRGLTELFDAAEVLAVAKPPRGDRLLILTNSGGTAVLAADELNDQGGRLARLTPETVAALDRVLPAAWSRSNPVDILSDAPGRRYAEALTVLAGTPDADAILVLHSPTAVSSPDEAAAAVIAMTPRPLVLTSWIGEASVTAARERFARQRIPTYDAPEQAVRAFMYLVRYRLSQQLLTETPPSEPEDDQPDTVSVRRLLARIAAAGRIARGGWLTDVESKQVLNAYGIATHPATERLGLSMPPMARRPPAYELFVGAAEDPQFGLVLHVGHGGTQAETIDDKAVGLPPLNLRLAHEMLSRTRIHRLLKGDATNGLDAVALVLVRVSQLICDFAEIAELDINPLVVDNATAVALGARIRIEATAASNGADPGARLAIRPYPKALEETVGLGDGRQLLLRPIRSEDEPALQRAFTKLTPEEIRMRFFVPMRTLDHVTAARFTQLDYDREMALVLTDPGIAGHTEIYGVVSLIADPANRSGEYAVLVRHDMAGMGLGILLMRRIIDYARSRGLHEICGDVLRENRTMLKLCQVLGFTTRRDPDDLEIVQVRLDLDAGRA